MKSIRYFHVGLVVLAVLAAMSFAAPLSRIHAQDGGTEEFPVEVNVDITGQIDAITVDETTGQTVLVIDEYEIMLPESITAETLAIEEGDFVTVTGTLADDDTFQFLSLVVEPADIDGDGVLNEEDNCLTVANADQLDEDEDGVGDICQTTDDEDTGDEDEDTDEDATDCTAREDHPVAAALAAEFDVDYETVMGWHCDGFGFGEISRALLLAEQSEDGQGAQDFLDMKADGMGWGQIVKESGVSPSELAPGRVISQKHNKHNQDDQDEDSGDDQTQTQNSAPAQGNGNGNGGGNGNGNNGNGNGNGGGNGHGKK